MRQWDHWSPAASDSAPSDGAPSGARTSEPALQTPAATARTVAAGVALSSGLAVSMAAMVIAVVAVGTAAALRLLFSGDARMTFDLASSALLLAGFAIGVAATLTVPNRWLTPRPATLGPRGHRLRGLAAVRVSAPGRLARRRRRRPRAGARHAPRRRPPRAGRRSRPPCSPGSRPRS